MTRGSFFKGLAALFIAPKAIVEIAKNVEPQTSAFVETEAVAKYIAGYTQFTKQMMASLPWLHETLPRLLLRDFDKKENDFIYKRIAE